MSSAARPGAAAPVESDSLDVLDALMLAARHLWLLIGASLLVGVIALASTFLVQPTFTARSVLLLPQQPQGAGALALQNLGLLSGGGAAVKSPADQYVSLMQSRTVEDRLIDDFGLIAVYRVERRIEARERLRRNTSIAAGRKDGLIVVEAEDHDPTRAADLANAYVAQLSRLTNELAVTEAQQRRRFFEEHLRTTTARFSAARRALQAVGMNEGALRAEPRAAAESYSRLRAEITAVEVRLESATTQLADTAPEVRRLRTELQALRAIAAKSELRDQGASSNDYVERYREFKYQETLLEMFSRQYELARVDESREGAMVQVVDKAVPPERKTRPRRGVIAMLATAATAVLFYAGLLLREAVRRSASEPAAASRWHSLSLAWRRTLGRRN